MADYTTGGDGGASAGRSYKFTEQFEVLAGILLPNSREEDVGFSVHFILSTSSRERKG